MAEQGIHKINSLRQKWIGFSLLADALLAVSASLVLAALLSYFLFVSIWWCVPLFFAVLGILLLISKPWQISASGISVFLDRQYPELEESSALVLQPSTDLALLQKLQRSKVEQALTDIPSLPKQFTKRAQFGSFFAISAVIIFGALNKAGHLHTTSSSLFDKAGSGKTAAVEKVLPQISGVTITITPPAYTHKSKRDQDKFTILAEEGASVHWRIKTNIAVSSLSILFNDKEPVTLKPNTDKTEWTNDKIIDKPGFYQVNVDGKLSDLYQVEIIKDNAPVIRIRTPKQYTYIDAGEAPKVQLTTTLTDDYGIADALIYATVAKGSGEGVKFKEYKIPFGESFSGQKAQYDLQHLFDLPKLDMEPGDELYFYIEAHDNHQQKSRTDVFTVSIQDTAALLSMDGIVNGSNLKPEYFRSQRQIIMDTEKLLKQRDSLSKDVFNSTSGDIGVDQKMLRLRYGKFLGEEEESNVGGPGENSELAKVENFNNAAMILDAYTDKHDNAEDATFFEPAIKAQLKATLTEMWNAELRLRMYKPLEALPFEYKALRLLKDLQQKSRAYVAKTAYKPIPFKMEKRLTGDMDKIIQPTNKQELKPGPDQYLTLKNAVQLLEQIRLTRTYSDADRHTLQLAKQQLSVKASAQPGVYLSAVSAMNRILTASTPHIQDIDAVEQAIQRTLPQQAQVPQNSFTSPDMGLAQRYYQNLKHNR